MTRERKTELRARVDRQTVASGDLAEALDYIDELEGVILEAFHHRYPIAIQDQIDQVLGHR
jgi:hypothetical protein